jgi:hypothetical protein
MAVVRPQVCRDYAAASDFFMMDQYPVPNMPMTWLSDSMDRAANDIGRNRLASVIQAFGGKKYANSGWPRLPTWQEMDCLAFLSVVHGSRAIFFYTFRKIGSTEEGRERLGRIVGRLNRLYPWLVERNLDKIVDIRMVSDIRMDPRGRPAIHCAVKKRRNQTLVIAVNSIGTNVEASIGCGESQKDEVMEVFSNVWYPVIEGRVRVKFQPHETKAFLYDRIP